MIEFVIEFIVELVFQLLFEVVIDSIGRGASRVLSSRVVRLVVSGVVVAACGFAGGYWWGTRLSGVRTAPPKLLYMSIALACAFAVAALVRSRDESPTDDGDPLAIGFGEPPWRRGYWSASRLTTFSIVNAFIGFGILAGFTPHQPG